MKKHIEITKKISAIIMLMLLLLPMFSAIAHSLEDHDHPICNEVTTHLHELETECSICDFHFQAYNFNPLQQLEEFTAKSYFKHTLHYNSITALNSTYNYLLRGPPQDQHDC